MSEMRLHHAAMREQNAANQYTPAKLVLAQEMPANAQHVGVLRKMSVHNAAVRVHTAANQYTPAELVLAQGIPGNTAQHVEELRNMSVHNAAKKVHNAANQDTPAELVLAQVMPGNAAQPVGVLRNTTRMMIVVVWAPAVRQALATEGVKEEAHRSLAIEATYLLVAVHKEVS